MFGECGVFPIYFMARDFFFFLTFIISWDYFLSSNISATWYQDLADPCWRNATQLCLRICKINWCAHLEPSYQICTYCYAPAWILGLNSGWACGLVVACLLSKCILLKICVAGLLGKLCTNGKFLRTRNYVFVIVWTNGGSWSELGFLGQVMRSRLLNPCNSLLWVF